MLGIDLSSERPFVKNGRITTADVTGVMGFTGDKRGSMSFSTSISGALAIYTRLVSEECREITPEVIDAIGELTNIISGQARKELEKESLHLTAHVPMVFVGKGIEINYITKMSLVSIPFFFSLNGEKQEVNLDCVFE